MRSLPYNFSNPCPKSKNNYACLVQKYFVCYISVNFYISIHFYAHKSGDPLRGLSINQSTLEHDYQVTSSTSKTVGEDPILRNMLGNRD